MMEQITKTCLVLRIKNNYNLSNLVSRDCNIPI